MILITQLQRRNVASALPQDDLIPDDWVSLPGNAGGPPLRAVNWEKAGAVYVFLVILFLYCPSRQRLFAQGFYTAVYLTL